jgi:CRISPR-associated protein Csd1
MILQALNELYERWAGDPDSGIAPAGYSQQKIAFKVVINPDGTLHGIESDKLERDGKLVPKSVLVCGSAKPSGSGINPCFLWDNPAYMLGYKPDDPKPERTQEAFEAFRQKHLKLEAAIDDAEFSAVCRFLEQWNPEQASQHAVLVETPTGFGLFQIRGRPGYVHQSSAVKNWWQTQLSPEDGAAAETETGLCLVTGTRSPLARVHDPKIKGVLGAQSSGAAIVSFNFDAVESYGKSQSYNAPVSETAAFQYCTALNQLLSKPGRRRQIGDATTVFWTAQPCPAEDILPSWASGPTIDEDPEVVENSLNVTLRAIANGQPITHLGDPSIPCYVLGLSPNAARISIRFWQVSRLDEFIDRIREHHADLQIVKSARDPEFLWLWQILRETARETKDIPPLLGGGLMRAILTGQPYPQMLLAALIRRIRADREINYVRAAAIKACLNRQTRFQIQPLDKELTVALDETRPETAYHLGRLFAALEKSQEDAQPGINATIKDRYFGAASSTPASVFPRLIRLNQHHMGKLEPRFRVAGERRIQSICSRFDHFPKILSLRDQGLFAIGYYHQRQDLFTKKSDSKSDSSAETPLTTSQE